MHREKIYFNSSLFNARVFICEYPFACGHSNHLSYKCLPLLLRSLILPSIMSVVKGSCFIKCPISFSLFDLMIDSKSLFSSTIWSISSLFFFLSVQLIRKYRIRKKTEVNVREDHFGFRQGMGTRFVQDQSTRLTCYSFLKCLKIIPLKQCPR